MSSIPPVPNVILARPGRTQPCPISDACWSPAIPAIGGAPGSAVASPTMPVESTMAGQHARRDAQHLEHMVVPSVAVAVHEAGDAGVGQVGDVELRRSRASTRSTCRRCRSRGRRGCARDRPCRAGTRASWPTGSERTGCPAAASTRHMPAVRRSCHPTPGPTGSPVARSQTIVDARWFAMPTASTGPPAASAALAASRAASAISAASNSTNAGRRRRRQHLAVVHVVDARVGTNDRRAHSARSDVDDEDAHDAGSPLTRRAPPRVASGLR